MESALICANVSAILQGQRSVFSAQPKVTHKNNIRLDCVKHSFAKGASTHLKRLTSAVDVSV
jgi:uncharacterized protein (DUF2062 family)